MAVASESDIKDLIQLNNVLEGIVKYNHTMINEFEPLEDKERKFFSNAFNDDGDFDLDGLISYLYGLTHGLFRVTYGYQVLFYNTADPHLDHLDFNKDIKEAFDLWNKAEEALKEGKSFTITPESELGKTILAESKGKEEDNET